METLSVIIPNYNKERYIEKCIDSILNQSYTDIEIIVIDDASTDNSREIIRARAEEYNCIKYIFLECNGGVSNARNVGLKNATGNFVTFIDSDDYYANINKLENEMKLLLQSENPKKSLAYSIIQYVGQGGEKLHNRRCNRIYFVSRHPLSDLLSMKKFAFIPRDYCLSKETLIEIGAYSFEKDLYEDLDLLMRLAVSKIEFLCTYEIGTAYRQGTGGLSSKQKEEHIRILKMIKSRYWRQATVWEKIRSKVVEILISIYEGLREIKHKVE